ncbi:hypothetical protein KL942_003802 [Ogataea angusta]|nr:hypothetical protein KL942_003802 [Ogataea angusta]
MWLWFCRSKRSIHGGCYSMAYTEFCSTTGPQQTTLQQSPNMLQLLRDFEAREDQATSHGMELFGKVFSTVIG